MLGLSDWPQRDREREHTPKRQCKGKGGSPHPGLSGLKEIYRPCAELQVAHGHASHLELVATDVEAAWAYWHGCDTAIQERETRQAPQLANRGLRKQETTREKANRWGHTETVYNIVIGKDRATPAELADELDERAEYPNAEQQVRAEKKNALQVDAGGERRC